MPRTLTIHTDNFDTVNTFRVDVGKGKFPATCSLYCGYQKAEDGIYWALQHAACVAAHYSDDEIAEKKRLNEETPLQNGDTILIEGSPYTVRVLGDFSNCALFDPA